MAYGLLSTGFAIKTQATIVAELQAAYQAAFGLTTPPTGTSLFGQLVGIHAAREADLWLLAQAVYLSAFPDSAQGANLAAAATTVGQAPLPAAYSTTVFTLTGTPGTVVPAGSRVGASSTATGFTTLTDATIGGGGTVTAAAIGTTTGPLAAPAGTLTTIQTPVAGWTSVTNAADATVGRNAETDAAFRARRATTLVTAPGGPISAMQVAVGKVAGVTFCGVQENRTDTAGTLPAHSCQVTVIGGADQDVANAIWAARSPGINTSGTSSGTVLDSFGNLQTVYWVRGTAVPVYLDVAVTRDPVLYPVDGDAQVLAALLAYGVTLGFGSTVYSFRLGAALGAIAGINGVVIKQGTAPSPASSADTAMTGAQQPTFASANVTIH